jgi:hypothetical protein
MFLFGATTDTTEAAAASHSTGAFAQRGAPAVVSAPQKKEKAEAEAVAAAAATATAVGFASCGLAVTLMKCAMRAYKKQSRPIVVIGFTGDVLLATSMRVTATILELKVRLTSRTGTATLQQTLYLHAESSSGVPLADSVTLADAAAEAGLTDGDGATMYFYLTIGLRAGMWSENTKHALTHSLTICTNFTAWSHF